MIPELVPQYLLCLVISIDVVKGQETTNCFPGFSCRVFTEVIEQFRGNSCFSFNERFFIQLGYRCGFPVNTSGSGRGKESRSCLWDSKSVSFCIRSSLVETWVTETSDLAWLSFTSGSGFLGSSCGSIPLVMSGKVTGFKPAEDDWVGWGCSSPVADDSILGMPASQGKVAFTSEMGDEIVARRVGSEGRDRGYLCKT